MDFHEKTILVTGGSRRGGAEIVRAFAETGAHVFIHANTHLDEAHALCAALPGTGHQVLVADFSLPGAAEKLFAEVKKIDILINNASFFRLHPEGNDAESRLFEIVNYETPKRLMELFVQQLLDEGCVVNILDQAVLGDQHDPYTESRRKLMHLTLDHARRYGAKNLRFNAVAPGPMLPPVELPDSKMEKVLQSVPLHRKVKVADFARAVLFLAQCDSITGAILPVDGGQHLEMKYEIKKTVRSTKV